MEQRATELELIDRAVNGDAAALERLLLAYYDRLEARIARKLPAWLHGVVAAEDVLQQAFFEAFRAVGSFRPRGKFAFYRWLATIADRRLQDAIKAERAAKRGGAARAATPANMGIDSTDDLIDLLAGSTRTPSRSAARHEAAGAVHAAVAGLKDDYRQVIHLRYVQGLPVAEVAQAMNRTENAVHKLSRRALNELHAMLGATSKFFSSP
ncbi:MAG: RNA polymerase sigma factor [Planctomycetota bacterium]|jgi:RNA polymerase sigma-70 factor (ECF subfamily)